MYIHIKITITFAGSLFLANILTMYLCFVACATTGAAENCFTMATPVFQMVHLDCYEAVYEGQFVFSVVIGVVGWSAVP